MQTRIAINAQLLPGRGAGGVESLLIAVVSALGKLTDGDEEYVIIGPSQEPEWLKPHLGPNQRIVAGPESPKNAWHYRQEAEPYKNLLGPLRPAVRNLWRRLWPPMHQHRWPEVPVSDGFYESLGCDVIHFPFQQFVVCALPSIYQPADIQHVHYPQFFTPESLVWRETIYRAGCNLSHTIIVVSQWIKDDLMRHYGISPHKVQVISAGPPTGAYSELSPTKLEEVRATYHFPASFLFYPAMPWRHKNHVRLLQALAALRDRRGLKLNLVCTGHKDCDLSDWPRVEQAIKELRLEDQVQFVGLVPPEDLRAIYRLAQFIVIPTLFEAASGPLFEAWLEGTPAACSTVTSLPEQAGDAALLFDPMSVEAMADAISRMATDASLRDDLRRRGTLRLQDFDWERTAKAFRAVYRRCANVTLTEEDRWLLNWNWMREPKKKMGGT